MGGRRCFSYIKVAVSHGKLQLWGFKAETASILLQGFARLVNFCDKSRSVFLSPFYLISPLSSYFSRYLWYIGITGNQPCADSKISKDSWTCQDQTSRKQYLILDRVLFIFFFTNQFLSFSVSHLKLNLRWKKKNIFSRRKYTVFARFHFSLSLSLSSEILSSTARKIIIAHRYETFLARKMVDSQPASRPVIIRWKAQKQFPIKMSGHECRKFFNFNAFTRWISSMEEYQGPWPWWTGGKFHTYAFCLEWSVYVPTQLRQKVFFSSTCRLRVTLFHPFKRVADYGETMLDRIFNLLDSRGPGQFFAEERCADPCNSYISPAKAAFHQAYYADL